MKARCLNPKNPEYKNYGGRGISICDAWNVIINRYKSGLPPEKVLSTKRFYGKSFKTQKEAL